MNTFSEIALDLFSGVIVRYGLTPQVVDSNEILLVSRPNFVLQVSRAPNNEIDFSYYTVNEGGAVAAYSPVDFIVTKRQSRIPRDKLNKSPQSLLDDLRNYIIILTSAGEDILSGYREWTEVYGRDPDQVSPSDAVRFKDILLGTQ